MYCGNSCFDFYDGDIKMNERIKELADQVGAVHNVLAMGRHDGVLFTETELEKFAELIVRECSNIAEQYDAPKMSGPGMIIAGRIESHFGVAE